MLINFKKFILDKKNNYNNKNFIKNGYVFLEVLISILLFGLLLSYLFFMLSNFLSFDSKTNNFYESLENIKLAYVFLDRQLDRSKKIEISESDQQNGFLKLFFDSDNNNENGHAFYFDKSKQMIRFGEKNELARGFDSVSVSFNSIDKILEVKIIHKNKNFETVILEKNIKNKIVILKK
ncbi:MAG: hypothetical protein LBJ93_00445 [Clostridiales bacterium]|jgi:hypothetical protein|nr:hypothetical protein [Clostridiales bacterium]